MKAVVLRNCVPTGGYVLMEGRGETAVSVDGCFGVTVFAVQGRRHGFCAAQAGVVVVAGQLPVSAVGDHVLDCRSRRAMKGCGSRGAAMLWERL